VLESSLQAPELNTMRLYVYRRPLHPELFGIFLEQKINTRRYEADLWVIGLGHLACFHTGKHTVTELVSVETDLMPETGLVEKLELKRARERQFCIGRRIHYYINTQSEQMSDAVFERFYEEMTQFGQQRGLFIKFDQWSEEGQPAPFSLIDYEHRAGELSVFGYHAFPKQKLALRTQSIFSLAPLGRSEGPQ